MFYNRATTPDLNGPGPVSFEYLQAYFVERDDVRAAEYQCGDDSGLKSLRALRTEIDDRHKSTGIDFGVGIGGVSPVSQSGDVAVIEARIEISSDLNGVPRQEVEHWHLTLRNTNGWRVCTAQEVD